MSQATTIASRRVFEGDVFSVTVDRVRLPEGVVVELEVVHHPGSVVLLAMPDAGSLILVRQYRYCADRYLWELPAGRVEPGEEPAAAARRECHEEVGLLPERTDLIATLWPSPGFCTERMLFYRCTDLRVATLPATRDDDEFLEPRTFTLEEVAELAAHGEIADMKTVVGLSLARGRRA